MSRYLFHLCQHSGKGSRWLKGCYSMVKVGRGGGECLRAACTRRSFLKGGNPFATMRTGKMYKHVRLCLCGCLAMCARKCDTRVRIRFSRDGIGVCLRHMLEVRGFLDKLFIRTLRTRILIVLHMLCLYMVIHCILLCRLFGTVLTLKGSVFQFHIIGFCGGCRHSRREER